MLATVVVAVVVWFESIMYGGGVGGGGYLGVCMLACVRVCPSCTSSTGSSPTPAPPRVSGGGSCEV